MDFDRSKQLYSVEETAKMLGISRAMLYRQIACHRIVPMKIGDRTLFRMAAITSFIELMNREIDESGCIE